MSSRVLVVEDELVTRHLLTRLLETEGHVVIAVSNVAAAEASLLRDKFDLILLDLMLGGEDGLTLLRRIRGRQSAPIVIVSAKGESADVVTGLELGADDYVIKPFNVDVLLARLRAHLRRGGGRRTEPEEQIRAGNIVIDPGLRDALVDDRPAGLTQKEYQLLQLLALRHGRAVPRNEISDILFDGEIRSDKILAVYIRRLREKIEKDPENPDHIHTIRGFGYRFG